MPRMSRSYSNRRVPGKQRSEARAITRVEIWNRSVPTTKRSTMLGPLRTRALIKVSALAALILPPACGDRDRGFISSESLDHDQVFVIELGETGRPQAILGALRPRESGRTPIEFSSRSAQLVLVGFDDEDLEPLYRRGLGSVVAAIAGPEDQCADSTFPGLISESEKGLRRALPAEARLHTHAAESDRLGPSSEETERLVRASLVLDVPVDLEGCTERAESERVLRAFASVPVPISLGTLIEGNAVAEHDRFYTDVARTDDDRALVTSPRYVFLFERGRSFDSRAGRVVAIPEARQLETVAIDLDPARGSGSGARRVFVGGSVGTARQREGRIWELSLDDTGLSFVGTATETPVVVHDLHIDSDTGRVVAAAEAGFILVESSPGSGWRIQRVQADPVDDTNPSYVTRTGWPDRPFVTGGASDQSLYLSNTDLSHWIPVSDGLDVTRTYRAFGGVATQHGPELWTVSTGGAVFHLGEGASVWNRAAAFMPPSYLCGADSSCGWRNHQNRGTSLASIQRGVHSWVYVVGTDCFAVAELRDDLLCTSYLTVPDPEDPSRPFEVPLRSDTTALNEPRHLVGGEIRDGWLTLASELGAVYELWVGEGDSPE